MNLTKINDANIIDVDYYFILNLGFFICFENEYNYLLKSENYNNDKTKLLRKIKNLKKFISHEKKKKRKIKISKIEETTIHGKYLKVKKLSKKNDNEKIINIKKKNNNNNIKKRKTNNFQITSYLIINNEFFSYPVRLKCTNNNKKKKSNKIDKKEGSFIFSKSDTTFNNLNCKLNIKNDSVNSFLTNEDSLSETDKSERLSNFKQICNTDKGIISKQTFQNNIEMYEVNKSKTNEIHKQRKEKYDIFKTLLSQKKKKKISNNICLINKSIKFPIKYNQLYDNSYIFFIIQNINNDKITYYSYCSLFTSNGVLKQGIQVKKLYYLKKKKKIKEHILNALKNKLYYSYNDLLKEKKKIYNFLKKNCIYYDLVKLYNFKNKKAKKGKEKEKEKENENEKEKEEEKYICKIKNTDNFKIYKKNKKVRKNINLKYNDQKNLNIKLCSFERFNTTKKIYKDTERNSISKKFKDHNNNDNNEETVVNSISNNVNPFTNKIFNINNYGRKKCYKLNNYSAELCSKNLKYNNFYKVLLKYKYIENLIFSIKKVLLENCKYKKNTYIENYSENKYINNYKDKENDFKNYKKKHSSFSKTNVNDSLNGNSLYYRKIMSLNDKLISRNNFLLNNDVLNPKKENIKYNKVKLKKKISLKCKKELYYLKLCHNLYKFNNNNNNNGLKLCKKIINLYKKWNIIKQKKIAGYIIFNFMNFNKDIIYYNENKNVLSTFHENIFDAIGNNQYEYYNYNSNSMNNYDWFFNSFDYVGKTDNNALLSDNAINKKIKKNILISECSKNYNDKETLTSSIKLLENVENEKKIIQNDNKSVNQMNEKNEENYELKESINIKNDSNHCNKNIDNSNNKNENKTFINYNNDQNKETTNYRNCYGNIYISKEDNTHEIDTMNEIYNKDNNEKKEKTQKSDNLLESNDIFSQNSNDTSYSKMKEKKLNDIFQHISKYINRISKNINITNKNRYDDYPFDFLSKEKFEYISVLTPTINEIKTLSTILNIPLIKMNEYEKDCIWKFRFHLLNRKETLGKFLKCVNWENKDEEEEAIILLNKWPKPCLEDCLELFHSYLHHNVIKKYIIDIIKNTKKDQLKLYLFQLVQCLRISNYENIDNLFINTLIHKCVKSKKLSIYLHWLLLSETKDKLKGNIYLHIHKLFINNLMNSNLKKKKEILEILKNQNRFRNQLLYLTKIAKNKSDRIQNKTRKLRQFIFYYRKNYGYINIKDFIKNNIFVTDNNIYDFSHLSSTDNKILSSNIPYELSLNLEKEIKNEEKNSKENYHRQNYLSKIVKKNIFPEDTNKEDFVNEDKNVYVCRIENSNDNSIKKSLENTNQNNIEDKEYFDCNDRKNNISNSIYYLDNELTINYDINEDIYFFQYKKDLNQRLSSDISNESSSLINYIDDSKNIRIEKSKDNSFFSNFLQFNDNFDFFLSSTYSDEDNNIEILDDSINIVQKQKIKKIKTPLILPVDPNIELLSFLPEQSYVLRSSLYPIVIACLVRKKIKLDHEYSHNLIINRQKYLKKNIKNKKNYSLYNSYNSKFIKALYNSYDNVKDFDYFYQNIKYKNNNIFYKKKKIEKIDIKNYGISSIELNEGKSFSFDKNKKSEYDNSDNVNKNKINIMRKMGDFKEDKFKENEEKYYNEYEHESSEYKENECFENREKQKDGKNEEETNEDNEKEDHMEKNTSVSFIKKGNVKKKKSIKRYNEIYELSIKKYIYKAGDDLRQDHLVIQILYIIDNIWKNYGLNLKLTLYRVLALSTDDGFIEFVDYAESISSIKKNYKGEIRQYFIDNSSDPNPPLGFDAQKLENFISSCAGYSVITYILGIGDRHLDNLMVSKDGCFFHIDFGYIFGEDPKPFSPPMKLCKEMIEAMGGAHSVGYEQFLKKCCLGYKYLRYHSKLIISLLDAMCESGLKDMKTSPELCVLKVQEKFRLDLNDEAAEIYFLSVINASVKTLFPVVVDKLHEWALNWK
ncbi:phosphatidylinositol 3-kinase, putative [Plasmodium gallinaceum]|uniref:phosphatidylinositol 3-kinase n=1 Tax=Plasmodium gallinaceum TaxID=5849 RepID=A0A1J1H0F7_PLAGA|nr:phosphatidylinositol 3-kinase, putative [Plasmodium gallinaceum]CRG97931.1 phosphatidylinositol 3-kinase, putative [Plasmodium gallinaceum]